MTLSLDRPDVAPLVAPLASYGRELVRRAGTEALRLHAEEVEPEHLLIVTLADEESAAHRACVHAFADPQTIVAEALALASGILVVGSSAALPFSPLAVTALYAARERAARDHAESLDVERLLGAAVEVLETDVLAALASAGYRAPRFPPGTEAWGVASEGPLFRDTSNEARRILSSAARLAQRDSLAAISPAHIVLAALEADSELATRVGLTPTRARLVLAGRMADVSLPPARELSLSDAFRDFLSALPPGAGSLDLLLAFLDGPADAQDTEIAELFRRQRVTRPMLERARSVLRDPDPA